jgi:ATP-binding cassette, subfamily B, multidrug efflux pump
MPSPLRRLLPYHERYKVPFWGGAFMLLLARSLEALIPLFLRDAIDAIDAARPLIASGALDASDARAMLVLPVAGIAACIAVRLVTMANARRIIRRIANYVAYDLRKRVYTHLQLQGPAFFARNPTGDLMARAINDIALVRELIGSASRSIIVNVCMATVGTVAMLLLAPALAVILLLPLIPIGIVGWVAARRVFRRSLAVQAGFADLSEQVQGNLYGIRTIQALVQEDNEIRRFDAVSNEYVARFKALVRLNSFISALMPWMASFSTVVILGIGGSMVRNGQMTLGTFAAFFAYVGMVLMPVRELGQIVTMWQRGASGTHRLFDILDTEPEVRDEPRGDVPAEIRGHLRLRDLGYRYPGAAADALHGLDLEILPGETVAIMGRVGAGKSTLLNCFVRLVDPPPGTLTIDGADVRAYSLEQLRRQVVLVPQDPFLFAEMLRHNLSYDDPDRDDAAVWAAVDDADLAQTIKALEHELETLVGERGVTLSGGQKQRSALARGLIRSSPVLILDDCLSAVDTRTEEHILDRLFAARRGRTTLLVTNRVSTARHADRIVIIEAGRISQVGSHAELLVAGGWYAHLARTQRLGQRARPEPSMTH